MYPRIAVEGDARRRGVAYGEAARERVRRSIAAYDEVFEHYAGWDRQRVRTEAERFRAPIEAYDRRYLEEIEGIAEGAGVEAVDVLAINVRTEVIFAATARDAGAKRPPPECSSFAALPARTANGRLLVGQNWDWLPHAADTTVVLEVRQDDGPDFVTVVEAGLLAKFGLNSCGVAVLANAMVTDADRGEPGVPFHVLLRALLDAETLSDAVTALLRDRRSSSGNFLLAHEDGIAIDVEAAPGDYSRAFLGYPGDDGVLLHTNHFINGFDGRDVSVLAMPDSPIRLARLRQLVAAQAEQKLDIDVLQKLLADHATYPLGVCCHPDVRLPRHEQSLTLAAVIVDVAERTLWLAPGNPCTEPFERLEYDWLRKKPSGLRAVS